MKLVPPRALVAALVALLLPCALAASAQADFGVSAVGHELTASRDGPTPRSGPLAAGAHPDIRTTIDFDDAGNSSADSVRDLTIKFAPGVVAYVNNVPRCSLANFAVDDKDSAARCDGTQVGETSTTASTDNILLPTLTVTGAIYNLEAPAGAPAALGIDISVPLSPRIKLIAPVSVDPHDLGLNATLSGLANETVSAGIIPVRLHIDQIVQTLYGYVGGRPFFTSPTSCIPAEIGATATSHGGAVSRGAASYTPTDCENVPFDLSLETQADPATADSTSAISFDVKPGAGTAERVSAHVRTTTVVAAPGVLLNPALAAGLDACTDAGFQQNDTAVAANCPPSSKVGSIEFVSPILGSFPGTVYFGTQTPTDRLRLFLDVPLYGAHIKVSATVNPDYTTGQVTTKFSDLPQIAFTDFRLTFAGGAKSALVTPTTCGQNVSTAFAGPWSGGAQRTAEGSFTTTDCDRKFTPSMTTSLADGQAGANSPFTLTFDRPDRTVPVGRVAFSLPAGLIGTLALRGLTKCPLDVAAAGRCPESSRIGSVQSVVGSGGEPPTLPGSAYLTAPKVAGDPAGLSIYVPAKLGPVDAGTVIVGQRLVLRNDGGLDVVSDPIPALQLGIPLAIRRLIVDVDRPGFMRNPTSCGELQASGAFSPLDGGAGATATSTVTVSGCDRLPFKPKITGAIAGKRATSNGAHPQFTTRITQPSGQAAMKSATVELPRGISTNLETINQACPPEVLAQGRCSNRAVVATATAVSPLISRPLKGKTYLVRVGTGLPKLVVQLRGEVSLDLDGIVSISRKSTIVTTFGAIPDLPLSSFTLKFRGPQGVLTTVGNLCRRPPLTAAFVGQNGKRTSAKPRLSVKGCTTASASLRFRRGSGDLAAKVSAPAGGKLSAVALALPKGLAAGRATLVARAGGKAVPARAVKLRGRTLSLKLSRKAAARTVTVTVRDVTAGGALARRLAKRRGKLTLRVKTRQTNKASSSLAVRVKLR
jgi:hypothetical protein